jgi:probable phosphoglycerate mutase
MNNLLSAPLPTTVLVIRHAEVHNPKDIVYGRLPRFGLSARGREQSEVAARFLAARPVKAIFTSPLLRARQTARILTHYHPLVPIHSARALLEVRTAYQGSPNTILKPGFSFYEPLKDPGDETMQDVFNRMMRFLQRVVRRHAGETVVAVSHADPIAIMRVGLEGHRLTAANMHATVYPARASVTQITLVPGCPLTLTYFNVAEVSELKL